MAWPRKALEGLDAAMMVHPGGHDAVITEAFVYQGLNIDFFDKASHAARTERSINALETMIQSPTPSILRPYPSKAGYGIITDGRQATSSPAHSAASSQYALPTRYTWLS
jgi:hypothetical protein